MDVAGADAAADQQDPAVGVEASLAVACGAWLVAFGAGLGCQSLGDG